MSDFHEMYEGMKRQEILARQALEIICALGIEKDIPQDSVRISGNSFVFAFHGLQIYLENEAGCLQGTMHRLARSDQEEKDIEKNLSLILSWKEMPPEEFCRRFGFQKFVLPGEPKDTVRQTIKIARIVAYFIPHLS